MDSFNLLITEMLIEERQRELALAAHAAPERHSSRGGMKRALAATFVRVGLRLDPAAGEGLHAFGVTLAGQERGC